MTTWKIKRKLLARTTIRLVFLLVAIAPVGAQAKIDQNADYHHAGLRSSPSRLAYADRRTVSNSRFVSAGPNRRTGMQDFGSSRVVKGGKE